MIKLTRPDGSNIYISLAAIISVRVVMKHENPLAATMLELMKGQQAVMETVEEVLALIEGPFP